MSDWRLGNYDKTADEKFVLGYPYPTDYVEILLRKYSFDIEKIHNILYGARKLVISEIQNVK